MTFFDSLKKWFYTRNSSAASSDARVPLLDASGNPKGSDTMANLASVLGGIRTVIPSNSDLNNYTAYGCYYTETNAIVGSLSNCPVSSAFRMDVYECFDGRLIQEIHTLVEGWIRSKSGTGWNNWQNISYDIPTFYKDYTTLAALAGAVLWSWGSLGFKSLTAQSNIDNLDGGLYNGIGWNLGSNNVAGYLLSLKNSSDYRFQVALIYSSNSNEIYHRSYNVSYGWSEWKKVTSV